MASGEARALGRHYLATAYTDYLHTNFLAELIYRQSTGAGPAGMFFGLGPARRNRNFFDEPYPALILVDGASDFNQGRIAIRRWQTNGGAIMPQDSFFYSRPFPVNGLANARIVKSGDTILFQLDVDYDGVRFAPELSQSFDLPAVAPFLTPTNASIFFGTGDWRSRASSPTRFLQFSVQSAPPLLHIETASGDDLTLWWITEPGKAYQLQGRLAGRDDTWQNIGARVTSVPTSATNRIAVNPGGRSQFYRLLETLLPQ